MPRTKLDRPTPERHRKAVNKVIETAMIREDVLSHKELGERIGLSETRISNRFKNGWSAKELFLLHGVLHFNGEECVELIGGQA